MLEEHILAAGKAGLLPRDTSLSQQLAARPRQWAVLLPHARVHLEEIFAVLREKLGFTRAQCGACAAGGLRGRAVGVRLSHLFSIPFVQGCALSTCLVLVVGRSFSWLPYCRISVSTNHDSLLCRGVLLLGGLQRSGRRCGSLQLPWRSGPVPAQWPCAPPPHTHSGQGHPAALFQRLSFWFGSGPARSSWRASMLQRSPWA